jgi:hypothetical protein
MVSGRAAAAAARAPITMQTGLPSLAMLLAVRKEY